MKHNYNFNLLGCLCNACFFHLTVSFMKVETMFVFVVMHTQLWKKSQSQEIDSKYLQNTQNSAKFQDYEYNMKQAQMSPPNPQQLGLCSGQHNTLLQVIFILRDVKIPDWSKASGRPWSFPGHSCQKAHRHFLRDL